MAAEDLNIHLTTFNCGRSEVHIDYFASSLYSSLSKAGSLPPDLIVLALQEISPIGYAFLGGSLLAPYFNRIADALHKATQWSFGREAEYEHVLTRNAGMTGIMVFASKIVLEQIRRVEEAGTGVGLWEMGNKGAVGVRLDLEDTSVTFVAAHLAPAENAYERRNEDWKNICKTLVFESVKTEDGHNISGGRAGERQPLLESSPEGPHGLFSPPSYVFFAGDLNYRTSDSQPDPKDFESWPQPMATDADPAHWSKLLANDQLSRELNEKKTLHNLSEAPITFPPTYKYSTRAQKLAEETANVAADTNKIDEAGVIQLTEIQEQVWLWAKHRVPSWCDRILYLSNAPPTVHSYTALPVQPTSDHRPVSLSCSVPRKQLDKSQAALATPPFDIVDDWESRRTTAKRLEFIVGLGAYLGFTGQGRTVLGGTLAGVIAGYILLQYLLRS